jgi:hypothetical protein
VDGPVCKANKGCWEEQGCQDIQVNKASLSFIKKQGVLFDRLRALRATKFTVLKKSWNGRAVGVEQSLQFCDPEWGARHGQGLCMVEVMEVVDVRDEVGGRPEKRGRDQIPTLKIQGGINAQGSSEQYNRCLANNNR